MLTLSNLLTLYFLTLIKIHMIFIINIFFIIIQCIKINNSIVWVINIIIFIIIKSINIKIVLLISLLLLLLLLLKSNNRFDLKGKITNYYYY